MEVIENGRTITLQPISTKSNITITAKTHADGTVSIGVSGDNNDIKRIGEIQRKFDAVEKGKYIVGRLTDDELSTIKVARKSDGNLSNATGACSEGKCFSAAGKNPSPVTGTATIYRGRGNNPYPLFENNSHFKDIMAPCDTCYLNLDNYEKILRGNKK